MAWIASLRYALQRRRPLPGLPPVAEIAAARHAEQLGDDGAAASGTVLLLEPTQKVLQLLLRDPDLDLLHRRRRFLAVILHRHGRAILGVMRGGATRCVEGIAHL